MEGFRGEKGVSQICRERDIINSLYYKWRDTYVEHADKVFENQQGINKRENEDRIAELERMVGRLTVGNDILKKANRNGGR